MILLLVVVAMFQARHHHYYDNVSSSYPYSVSFWLETILEQYPEIPAAIPLTPPTSEQSDVRHTTTATDSWRPTTATTRTRPPRGLQTAAGPS